MAFDTSEALNIQAARTINVGRGSSPIGVPLFSDDFENGDASNSVFTWSNINKISTDRAYLGSQSLKFSYGPDELGEDSTAEQRFSLDRKYTEIWVRYKMWVPENYTHRDDGGPTNNKGLLMLWGDSYSGYSPTCSLHFGPRANGDSYIYMGWRVNSSTVRNFYNPDNVTDFDSSGRVDGIVSADRGTWVDWAIHMKVSTNYIAPQGEWDPVNDNGIIQVWKNGSLIIDLQNAHNYYSGDAGDPGGVGDGWNYGYLLGWANSGFTDLTNFYIDDFLFADTADGIGLGG